MKTRIALTRCFVSAVFAIVGMQAAAQSTFRITELYSNLDGSIQFVRLTETGGLNDEQHFGGLTLASTHKGIVKTFTFPHDLNYDQTAHKTVVAATTNTLQLSNSAGVWCCSPVAFTLPAGFLATDGGTVDFAGLDQVTYFSLPSDGENGLFRDGTVQRAQPPVFAIAVVALEYYNATLDHYFYTASAAEIDALDTGGISGWQRTGARFVVAGGSSNNVYGLGQPVCRFYIPPGQGGSHFFSASVDECAQVQERFPDYVLETATAFFVSLPDLTTGECPPDPTVDGPPHLIPVFRLWNHRTDSNHRYTKDIGVRNLLAQQGYVAEGYGPNAVAFCVPYSTAL